MKDLFVPEGDLEDLIKDLKDRKKIVVSEDKFDPKKEFYDVAGSVISEKIIDFFEDEETSLKWFYSQHFDFQGKSPYEVCKYGDKEEIDIWITRMDYGVYF